MDNRLRFLYYSMTELWGRRRRALPGMESRGKHRRGTAGKTGTSEVGGKLANPLINPKT